MTFDEELTAMSAVANAVADLEAEARSRVLRWAFEHFGIPPKGPMSQPNRSQGDSEGTSLSFGEFHELYDAARPESGLDRVLVAAYWFQVLEGSNNLDSFSLNRELKNMGQGSSNITRDLQSLMGRSPSLVMQVRKEGNTRQARKKYKLTRAGIQAVEEMLARQAVI